LGISGYGLGLILFVCFGVVGFFFVEGVLMGGCVFVVGGLCWSLLDVYCFYF